MTDLWEIRERSAKLKENCWRERLEWESYCSIKSIQCIKEKQYMYNVTN